MAVLTEPTLTVEERSMLSGEQGPGVALAMRVVVGLARVRGATELVPVTGAHIDSCLYHGQAGLDFAERLVELGAEVRIPATLNVGSLDLLHPGLVHEDTAEQRAVADGGRRLRDAYVRLGARQTWTCAPYQLDARPGLGEHVAWAESNAIVFANSVLGARTDRYGDFLDICSAITGRAPLAGLHLPAARRGQVVLDCSALSDRALASDLTYPVLGYLAGRLAGHRNPVFTGLPQDTGEDRLKSIGAAAASSGGVGLFHVVGVTPEAATLELALRGEPPEETLPVTAALLASARDELCTATDDHLDAVSLGTPHASYDELAEVARALADGPPIHSSVSCYLSTGRTVLAAAEADGLAQVLRDAGVRIVVDTCTYITAILSPSARVVMTNSGKWAHYAPGNLGVDVVLGGLEECLDSARAGRVIRDEHVFD